MQTEAPKEFWVHCGSCSHAWVAAYAPMEAVRFARCLKRATCASCGETRKLFTGKGEPKCATP